MTIDTVVTINAAGRMDNGRKGVVNRVLPSGMIEVRLHQTKNRKTLTWLFHKNELTIN